MRRLGTLVLAACLLAVPASAVRAAGARVELEIATSADFPGLEAQHWYRLFEDLKLGSVRIRSGRATDIRVDNDISFGRAFQSLRFRGQGGRAELTAPALKSLANDRLLFDVDLFLRSEASYVQLVPTAETTSSDEVGFAFMTSIDSPGFGDSKPSATSTVRPGG